MGNMEGEVAHPESRLQQKFLDQALGIGERDGRELSV